MTVVRGKFGGTAPSSQELSTTWERTMAAAAKSFERGDQDTGIAMLAYASWIAVVYREEVSKSAGDGAYRWVTDAAGCFKGEPA